MIFCRKGSSYKQMYLPSSFFLHTFIYVYSDYLHIMKSEVLVTQLCPTLWPQGLRLQSMGFSRHEYSSGLPFSSLGDLPHPGVKPESPTLQADSLWSEPPGKPCLHVMATHNIHIWYTVLVLNFTLSHFFH